MQRREGSRIRSSYGRHRSQSGDLWPPELAAWAITVEHIKGWLA